MAYAGMYTYRNPTTGQEYAYGDPTINRSAIEGQGLQFVQGPTGAESDPLAALRQSQPETTPISRYTNPADNTAALFPEAGRTFGGGDEGAIRETERKRVQSAIDAINESIANELASARQAGLGRLGRTRAMGAAFGLVGSPTGEAQRQGTEKLNLAEEREIEASRRLQIETMLGRADDRASAEIIARRQLAQTNQEKYLEFLGSQKTEARKDIETLAKVGANVEKNTEVYNRLMTQSGYDPLTFDSLLNYYKEEGKKIKYEHVYDSNTGELTLFGIDPKTQEPVFKKYKTDMAQGEVFKEIEGVPYAQKKDAAGNISLRKLEGFTPSAEKALDIEKKQLDIKEAEQRIAAGGLSPKDVQEKAEAEKGKLQQAGQSLGLVNEILATDTGKITGIGQNPLNYLKIANPAALNKYNQLAGLLKLGIRGLIKGQGQVSDYEGKILAQASSDLGRNLPNKQFRESLQKIRGVLKTNAGLTAEVTVTNQATGETIDTELNGQEIFELVSEGNTIMYK